MARNCKSLRLSHVAPWGTRPSSSRLPGRLISRFTCCFPVFVACRRQQKEQKTVKREMTRQHDNITSPMLHPSWGSPPRSGTCRQGNSRFRPRWENTRVKIRNNRGVNGTQDKVLGGYSVMQKQKDDDYTML